MKKEQASRLLPKELYKRFSKIYEIHTSEPFYERLLTYERADHLYCRFLRMSVDLIVTNFEFYIGDVYSERTALYSTIELRARALFWEFLMKEYLMKKDNNK